MTLDPIKFTCPACGLVSPLLLPDADGFYVCGGCQAKENAAEFRQKAADAALGHHHDVGSSAVSGAASKPSEIANDIKAAIIELADGRSFPELLDAVDALASQASLAKRGTEPSRAIEIANDIKAAIVELAAGRNFPDLLEAVDSLAAIAESAPSEKLSGAGAGDLIRVAMEKSDFTYQPTRFAQALIDEICARIKAADDKAMEGDYMLDSNDCISVIRGTWQKDASRAETPPHAPTGQDRVHDLKTWTCYYSAVASGKKPFEVRKDDRNFRVGDWLRLLEWNVEKADYTGRECFRRITYILSATEFVKDGFVVLGLASMQAEAPAGQGEQS